MIWNKQGFRVSVKIVKIDHLDQDYCSKDETDTNSDLELAYLKAVNVPYGTDLT